MVAPSRGLPDDMQQMAAASGRLVCNQVQQVISVCITSSRLPSLGSGCTLSALVGSGPLYLLTSSHSGEAGGTTKRLPMQVGSS